MGIAEDFRQGLLDGIQQKAADIRDLNEKLMVIINAPIAGGYSDVGMLFAALDGVQDEAKILVANIDTLKVTAQEIMNNQPLVNPPADPPVEDPVV